MNFSVDRKLAHLINRCHFKIDEIEEIRKLYSGQPFDPNDHGIRKLVALSDTLCEEYESLGATVYKTRGRFRKAMRRRFKILWLLFCGRFMFADVRTGLHMIIGLVDAPSLTFFNYDVTFSPALVTMGRGVEIAPKVKIGDGKTLEAYAETGLPSIEIGESVWIGIGATVHDGVALGQGSVCGAGADVQKNVPSLSLALGRPAKIKREIPKEAKTQKFGQGSPFTEQEENVLYAAVARWEKIPRIKFHAILSGWQFNLVDRKLLSAYSTTHHICEAMNADEASDENRQEGLKMLFPLRGENVTIGKRLHLDILGTSKLGDNVKIGNNVTLGGNLVIGNNVTLSDGCCLFASGHPLDYRRRKMLFSIRHGLVQIGQNELIRVADNVTIGENAIITPGSFVDRDVPAGAIWANNKLVG